MRDLIRPDDKEEDKMNKIRLLAFLLAICLLLPALASCDQIEDVVNNIVKKGNKVEDEFDDGEEDDEYVKDVTVDNKGDVGETTERGDNGEGEKEIAKIERVGDQIIITYKDGSQKTIDVTGSSTTGSYNEESTESIINGTYEDAFANNGYNVSVSGDGEYFRFVPDISGYYDIYSYSRSFGDPIVYLYDAAGNQLGYSDDSYGYLDFSLVYYMTAGETYYLNVRASGHGDAAYSFIIKGTVDAPTSVSTEAPTTQTTEAPTSVTSEPIAEETYEDVYDGESYYVEVDSEDVVSYRFVPEVSGYYYIYSSNRYYGDPYVYLCDGEGNFITSDNNGNGGSNFYLYSYMTAGETYYICVCDYYGSSTAFYLYISGDESTFEETYDTVYANQSYWASVNQNGQSYRFVPEVSGYYEIYSYNRYSGDPIVYLYSANGVQITYDDDSNGDSNFSLTCYMTAGETYYIKVGSYYAQGAEYYFYIGY